MMTSLPQPVEIKTDRLLLRQWTEQDFPLFAKICADPVVMEFFPKVYSQEESDAFASKTISLIEKKSWGFWAVELIEENKFIGFVGLNESGYLVPVSPCIEIGWRLDKDYWGKGYATEAARASLQFAFEVLQVNEVYSFTSIFNKRSWLMMLRLGMQNTGDNFDHPMVPQGHVLKEHVLYKISMTGWNILSSK